jgi:hypothetical protein
LAISGIKGSFGLGSDSIDRMDKSVLEIVSAGDQAVFRISIQMKPFVLIFG